MNKATHHRFLKMLAVALIALFASEALYLLKDKKIDTSRQIEQFRETFVQKDLVAEEALARFRQLVPQALTGGTHEQEIIRSITSRYDKEGLSFFMYHAQELKFWTHSTIPFELSDIDEQDFGVINLRNGWYFYRQRIEEDDRFLVLSVIQYGFRYQNSFLVNRFQADYQLPDELYFITDRSEEGSAILNADGNYAFSLNLRRTTGLLETRHGIVGISACLAILGLGMMVFFLFRYFSQIFHYKHKVLAITGFTFSMILIRLITFLFATPGVFYDGSLFSPGMYATSSMLPSLGDLFLNVLVFSVVTFFLFTHLKRFAFRGPLYQSGRLSLAFGLFALIYLFCNLTVFLIKSLVMDSHLNLDVNFIFSLDLFSLVGFLIIGCIFFSFFFLSVVLVRVALNLMQKQSQLWWIYMLSLLIFILWHWVLDGPNPLQWLLFVSAILVFEMERKSESPQAGFASLLVSLFLFSLVSSLALYQFNREKDLEKRKTMALQLASEQDPVAEFLFLEMEVALFNDHQLQNLVRNDPYNENAVYRYLQHHYFYDFWAKYDLQVTVCQPDEILLIKPSNVHMECAEFFEEYMATFGKATISNELIYLDNNTGRNSYIAQIPVRAADAAEGQEEYFIFLEFDSKYIARDLGFPELLIDDKIDINRDLVNYSHATYKDGTLISKSGMYNYSINASVYDRFEGEFAAFVFEDYRHLLFRKDDTTLILISRPTETFLERIAPFSYLFILFFLLVVIFYMLTSKRPPSEIFRLNFKRRVQVSMITIVIVSVLAIGGASAWFILDVSGNKNMSFLSERAHSILIETEMTLDMENIYQFNPQTYGYLSDLLLKQSNVFFTDINLYDVDGRLVASSRPKVFEEGLVGMFMNPTAFYTLKNHHINQFIHREHIGKLQYLSAYMMLRNHYQEPLGYINLPYFAKQGELRDEMSYFLVAFINIYLLLLVIAIVVALFISNFVTQPLQLIRENLSKLQLGRTNQKIEWTRNDEIGGLVTEYNRMIDELAESAGLLARSERETAWREMAKQVAHEIKNPLTPMRLSIQYLEKAWKENAPDWEKRLERFSRTMVEQIDNLALIAGAFSDFAQMPAGNNHLLDFRTFLPESIHLFNDTERIQINLNLPRGDQPLMVKADRNQMIRVINNLINNAIQAYPKNKLAIIDLNCNKEAGDITVEVKDYGYGIPDALKPNIFSPNFTTKTSGMGLGLSMVKAIIENLGGRVAFHSEEGLGSIFSFRLPEAHTP